MPNNGALFRNARQLRAVLAGWTYLSTPLTSTSWDGDAYSTTGKTKIDLSAVFGVPAGVKAVLVSLTVRDAGSAGTDCWFLLSPNATDLQGLACSVPRAGNDHVGRASMTVPCDANGDVYYQCGASGAGTMDVWLAVWGFYL